MVGFLFCWPTLEPDRVLETEWLLDFPLEPDLPPGPGFPYGPVTASGRPVGNQRRGAAVSTASAGPGATDVARTSRVFKDGECRRRASIVAGPLSAPASDEVCYLLPLLAHLGGGEVPATSPPHSLHLGLHLCSSSGWWHRIPAQGDHRRSKLYLLSIKGTLDERTAVGGVVWHLVAVEDHNNVAHVLDSFLPPGPTNSSS
ncbi:hypothetical protein MTO96_034005 [Rhipicephalus appendiculatus]